MGPEITDVPKDGLGRRNEIRKRFVHEARAQRAGLHQHKREDQNQNQPARHGRMGYP